MQAWEYHVTTLVLNPELSSELQSFLTDAGTNGWELVTTTQIQGHMGAIKLLVTLKRPRQSA